MFNKRKKKQVVIEEDAEKVILHFHIDAKLANDEIQKLTDKILKIDEDK